MLYDRSMEIRFWGVRGSVPCHGPQVAGVGGRTTCVSVHSGHRVLVFDAGTGVRSLGRYLDSQPTPDREVHLFLSHYHWDHIQGLPFFSTAIRRDARVHIYGEDKKASSLRQTLHTLMSEPFFPVGLDALPGIASLRPVDAGECVHLDDTLRIHVGRLQHPGGSLGFRLETPDGVFCVITDHEHPADRLDDDVVALARDADVLVHDAQYTPEEKAGPKAGWGHSSWADAARTAERGAVGTLFLSHHDPDRSDTELQGIRRAARKVFAATEIATEDGHHVVVPATPPRGA